MSIEEGTLVSRTARELARISMGQDDGSFIGAEEDLLRRLGVSRPTLRQAAKIAENDRLIDVRRGIRGGFYASRPNADDAIRMLARYLRMKGATLSHIMAISRFVSEEAAELAARCPDEGLRRQLRDFAARIDHADTRAALIEADGEMARLVATMSGNPAIELFMAIGYSFGMDEQGSNLLRDPAQRQQARKLQHDLCMAILSGDADIARLMMRRRSDAMSEWVDAAASG